MFDQSTFVEKCMRGEVLPEEIDGFIDKWHDGGSGEELHEFLGMSWEEYSLWVADADVLPSIIKQKPVRD